MKIMMECINYSYSASMKLRFRVNMKMEKELDFGILKIMKATSK
jgi:hypothetical protein